jgi:hypothetical protein
MENQETLSLYEYLGYAAGGELGKQVNEAAKKAKISVTTQEVSNPKYTGTVMKYPKYFLDEYFDKQKQQTKIDWTVTPDDDELPF